MPTEKKRHQVEELKDRLDRCTLAIATDYRGMTVPAMTELRRRLREHGVQYKVVKNRLALIAADQARMPDFQRILEGPTGIVFSYDKNPQAVAKVLAEYLKAARSALVIRAGVLDGRFLTAAQVQALATLPPRDELVSKLLGQLQAPIVGLVTVLNGPLRSLVTVLQRRVEQIGEQAA